MSLRTDEGDTIHGLCAICGAKVHKKFYFGKKRAEICAIIIIFATK
jgi:hypothetical protein